MEMLQRIIKYCGVWLMVVGILWLALMVRYGTSNIGDLGLLLFGSSWEIGTTEIRAPLEFVNRVDSTTHAGPGCVSLSIKLRNLVFKPLRIDSVAVFSEGSSRRIDSAEVWLPANGIVRGRGSDGIAVQWGCGLGQSLPSTAVIYLCRAIIQHDLSVTVFTERGPNTAKVVEFVTYDRNRVYYNHSSY